MSKTITFQYFDASSYVLSSLEQTFTSTTMTTPHQLRSGSSVPSTNIPRGYQFYQWKYLHCENSGLNSISLSSGTSSGTTQVDYNSGENFYNRTDGTFTYSFKVVLGYNKYNVTYNANGGTNTGSGSDSVTYPLNYTFKDGSTFSRTGYNLTGWINISSGTTYTLSQTILSWANSSAGWYLQTNITVNAVWTPQYTYTITYWKNDGTSTTVNDNIGPPSITVKDATTYTRIGYILKGWTDVSGSSVIAYTFSQVITGWTTNTSLTLYAIWEDVPVKLTDIKKRFNPSGTGSISLQDYYNNAGLVSGVSGIPSSGALDMTLFKGQ